MKVRVVIVLVRFVVEDLILGFGSGFGRGGEYLLLIKFFLLLGEGGFRGGEGFYKKIIKEIILLFRKERIRAGNSRREEGKEIYVRGIINLELREFK